MARRWFGHAASLRPSKSPRLAHAAFGLAALTIGVALPAPASAIPVQPGCGLSTSLVNGGFEAPEFPPASQIYYVSGAAQPAPAGSVGWATTASDNQIELWASNSNPSPFRSGQYGEFGTPSDTGDQFGELNATQIGTLYQDRPTAPGTVLRWRLAHRGRNFAETMRVSLGAPGATLDMQTPDGASSADIVDGIGAWGHYTGSYTVPPGQTTTRFAFASQNPGGEGNFLDSVVFNTSATACNDSARTVQDQPVFIDAIANDVGDQTVLGAPGTPSNGTVTRVGGQYRYVPAAGFTGTDSFTYAMTDSFGASSTGTVTVIVSPVAGSAPAAPDLDSQADETVTQTETISIPSGGSARLLDSEGVPRTRVVTAGVGTYTLDTGTGVVTFAPAETFIGDAPIRYEVTGANGRRATGEYTPDVVALPRSTTGLGDFTQEQDLNFAEGGSVGFLAPDGSVVSRIVVPGVGRYSVTPAGRGTFEPAAGYTGTPAPQAFRLTDAAGGTADNTWAVEVTAPQDSDFSLSDKNSDGPEGGTQTARGYFPSFSQYTVRIEFGTGGTAPVTVPGVGTYSIEPGTGRFQFTPVRGFYGSTETTFRVRSSFGFVGEAVYSVFVTAPGADEGGNPSPAPGTDVSSVGTGTARQSTGIPVPTGGSAQILDGDRAFANWVDEGKGRYTIDAAAGTIAFVPALGYVGSPTPIRYQIISAGGDRTLATYAPEVLRPPAPSAEPAETTGAPQDTQTTTSTVPDGGSVTLLDTNGGDTNRVVIAGEGVYELDPASGRVTFAAQAGFTGQATGVRYRVTDAYGQSATAIYAAAVTPAPDSAPVVPPAGPGGRGTAGPTKFAVCLSKRVFTVHWSVDRAVRLRSVTVSLSGKSRIKLSGKARQARIDLRGRAAGRANLTISATTTSGRMLKATRRYRTCTPTRPGSMPTLRLKR